MNKLAILAIAATMVASTASAQSAVDCYINAGVGQLHTRGSDTTELNGRVGVNLNPNFGIEAEGGFGVSDDNKLIIKQNGNLGAFGVARAEVAPNFALLGRMGYSHAWTEQRVGNRIKDVNDGSFAIGAGAQFMFDENNGVRLDYTRLTKDKGADKYGVSFVRKF